jgi:hypothetical protein
VPISWHLVRQLTPGRRNGPSCADQRLPVGLGLHRTHRSTAGVGVRLAFMRRAQVGDQRSTIALVAGSVPRASSRRTRRASRPNPENAAGAAASAAIPPRVGHEEQDAVDVAVPFLQRDPPFDRLDVLEDGLRFHTQPPPSTADERVPCSWIAFCREGNLGSPPEVRVEPQAESLDQALLARIPDRFAGGVCAQAELEADGRRHRRQHAKVRIADVSALDPAGGGTGDVARCPDEVETQPGSAAACSELEPDAVQILLDPPSGPLHGSSTDGHVADGRRWHSSRA